MSIIMLPPSLRSTKTVAMAQVDEKPEPAAAPSLGPKASQALIAVLAMTESERVTVGELVAALHERAFGFMLLMVALINCVPLPPGVSSLAGIPVLMVGLQLLLGRPRPWLPGFIARRGFRRRDLLKALHRISPYLVRIERIARPRYPRLLYAIQPHIVGLAVVALSLFIITPMMFTNIPPAMATVFLAIALIEEDGLLLAVGLGLAVLAMTVSTTLAAGAVAAVLYTGSHILGL